MVEHHGHSGHQSSLSYQPANLGQGSDPAARLGVGKVTTPDWPKLRATPWSAQVAQVAAALGHTDIPPEGRPRSFHSELRDFGVSALHTGGFILRIRDSASFHDTPEAVAEATHCRVAGGPTNQALRQWLRWWGWNPPTKPTS